MIVTESQKHIVGGGVVKGLVKIITDAQNVLAEYIEPDSGISDTECINRLLGVLDHQGNVRFVRSALVAPEGAEEVEAIAEYLRERDEAIGNESEYATDEERRATAEAIVALRRSTATDKPGVREAYRAHLSDLDALRAYAGKAGHMPLVDLISKDMRVVDQKLRALSASPLTEEQPVAEGWKLVPVEPTEVMLKAGMEVLMFQGDIYANSEGQIVVETTTPKDTYRAMLAAAPLPRSTTGGAK